MECIRLTWVVFVLLTFPAVASSNAFDKLSILNASKSEEIALKPFLKVWHPQQPISLKEAAAPENGFQYQPFTAPLPKNREAWFRLVLNSDIEKYSTYVLTFPDLLIDQLDVHLKQDGQWLSFETGWLRPYRTRAMNDRLFSFPLNLTEGENVIYFRVHSLNSPIIAPLLNSSVNYNQWSYQISLHTLLPSTLVLGVCIFILMLYLVSSQATTYLAYLSFMLMLSVLQLYYNGYFFDYFPDNPILHAQLSIYLVAIANVSSLWFFYSSFDVGKTMPILKWCAIILFILSLVIIPLHFMLDASILFVVKGMKGSAILLALLAIVIRAIMLQLQSSMIYLVTVIGFMLIIFTQILGFNGFISDGSWARNISDFSLALLSVGFGYALLSQVAVMQKRQAGLEHKAAVAEASNRTKSAFLATMSHEIRTPINGIMGMAQILRRSVTGRTDRYYVEVLLNATHSLLNVLNDILDLSKIEAGKLKVEIAELKLDKILIYIDALYNDEKRNSQVQFITRFEGVIPLYIRGDKNRLQQIITNLLGNAFKFTKQGKVILSVQRLDDPDDRHVRIKFSVKDTGIGINEETKKRLFLAYEQADNSTTRNYGGTGLGLAICKQLVELMGGKIDCSSVEGEGSEFWFILDFEIDDECKLACDIKYRSLRGKKLALLFSSEHHSNSFYNHFSGLGMAVKKHHISDSKESLSSVLKWADIVLTSSQQKDCFGPLLNHCNDLEVPGVVIIVEGHQLSPEIEMFSKMIFIDGLAGLAGIEEALRSLLSGQGFSNSNEETYPPDIDQLSHLRLLIAEDNPVNSLVAKALLSSVSIKPTLVENGSIVSTHYQENYNDYDMILMDCDMPVIDGYQATTRIRQFEQENNISPIFICALTAHAFKENQQRCIEVGMNDVLVKPLDLNQLTDMLYKANNHIQ